MFALGAWKVETRHRVWRRQHHCCLLDGFHLHFGIYLQTLSICVYVCGPRSLSHLSHLQCRVYIASATGCELSTDTAMFLVFLFIRGWAASASQVVGGAIVADLYDTTERRKSVVVLGLRPLLGPVVGQVIGGFVAQCLGWCLTVW
ncbi:hypothetical protein F4861DRAFT_136739 [Xylaria intraflava]|nr:hypothetical protein F4861DRAFT_136739 [Xylaria intraflava]